MRLLRWLVVKYPYRGLFGWATLCVWGFLFAEILWHLSRYFRRYDLLEIPMVVPYAPIALLIDPHDAMLYHDSIFFVALANWFGIFVIGAAICLRKASAAVVGGTALIVIQAAAIGRVVEYWIVNPPPPVP